MRAQRHCGNQPTIQHAADDLVGNRAGGRREDRPHTEHGGRQQRFGQQCPPGFLEYDGQHAQAEPEPATVFRDGQRADAHLVVEHRPQLRRVALRAVGGLADLLVRRVGLQEVAHHLAQVLVLGDRSKHGGIGLGPRLDAHSSSSTRVSWVCPK